MKKLVILADGTGSAFRKQESNIWRLYQILDSSASNQMVLYIPGVGTSNIKPWAIFDAITGVGVPSNVRLLYEFLCQNYVKGDEIYVFGFSRGAFTVRTLVGMVAREGLVSTVDKDGIALPRAEMRRRVMKAWRSFRASHPRSFRWEGPSIWITRLLRDWFLKARDKAMGYEPYDCDANLEVESFEFVGLFDTVEAYGVPIAELRDVINWAIWPIKFRNHVMDVKVKEVSQALALDDERQTFHPLHVDKSNFAEGSTPEITEVWFAGSHSDVGGGFPDDTTALVPLNWMLDQLGDRLQSRPDRLATYKARASALGPRHDSRAGTSLFYRYEPRKVGAGASSGRTPVIHHSVIERMVFGGDDYAPLSIDRSFQVLLPDLKTADLGAALPAPGPEFKQAYEAFSRLQQPFEAYASAVADGIWIRRKAYFLFMVVMLGIVALPLARGLFRTTPTDAIAAEGPLSRFDGAIVAIVQEVAVYLAPFVPSYVQPWFKALVDLPLLTITMIAIAGALHRANDRAKDRIEFDSRAMWGLAKAPQEPRRHWLYRVARRLRTGIGRRLSHTPFYYVVCSVSLAALLLGGYFVVDYVALDIRVGSGSMCFPAGGRAQKVTTTPITVHGFRTSEPCWYSGLELSKGRSYTLTIDVVETFMDRDLIVDPSGTLDSSFVHVLALPLKRWVSEPYFQPIARIKASGMTEWPLRSVTGEGPRELGADAWVKDDSRSGFDPCGRNAVSSDVVDSKASALGASRKFVSRFVAPETGELYLYVNDAVYGADILAGAALFDRNCYYANNRGRADVTLVLTSSDGR